MMKNLYKALYGFYVETEKNVALWGVVLVSGACVKNVKEYVWHAFCLEMGLQNLASDTPKHYVWGCQTHCLRRSNSVFDNFNTCIYRTDALCSGLSAWTSDDCNLHAKKRAYFALAISGTGIEGTHEGVFWQKIFTNMLPAGNVTAVLFAWLQFTMNMLLSLAYE